MVRLGSKKCGIRLVINDRTLGDELGSDIGSSGGYSGSVYERALARSTLEAVMFCDSNYATNK